MVPRSGGFDSVGKMRCRYAGLAVERPLLGAASMRSMAGAWSSRVGHRCPEAIGTEGQWMTLRTIVGTEPRVASNGESEGV
jgi:hypothetical protein